MLTYNPTENPKYAWALMLMDVILGDRRRLPNADDDLNSSQESLFKKGDNNLIDAKATQSKAKNGSGITPYKEFISSRKPK